MKYPRFGNERQFLSSLKSKLLTYSSQNNEQILCINSSHSPLSDRLRLIIKKESATVCLIPGPVLGYSLKSGSKTIGLLQQPGL